jgi:hypothetical protein
LHRAFAAVRDPERTEAVHQRIRVLADQDGVVQGSVGVEDSDAVRRQGAQSVLGLVREDDGGDYSGRGHDREDDAHDQPPRAQPWSSTARRRLRSRLRLGFRFWLSALGLRRGWRMPRQSGIMREHLLVKPLQRRAGVDAEFVGELVTQLVIGGERVRRPAGPIESDDPLAVQTFVERITGHQFVELAEHGRVPAERQLRVDLGLDRGLPAVGEPRRHRRDELVIGQIGEDLAAPQGQRPIELGYRVSGPAVGKQAFAPVDGEVEHNRVEGLRRDSEAIPAIVSDDDSARRAPAPIRFQRLTQMKNVRLDGARGADRNLLTPQPIGQLVDGEAGTVGEQQPRQDRALLPAT